MEDQVKFLHHGIIAGEDGDKVQERWRAALTQSVAPELVRAVYMFTLFL
jgi:hypothetical protein